MSAVKVTVSHPDQGEETAEIEDDYILVCAGACYRHGVVIHRRRDGSETHVITVKGIKR